MAAGCLVGAAGCSLLVDTNGLSGGSADAGLANSADVASGAETGSSGDHVVVSTNADAGSLDVGVETEAPDVFDAGTSDAEVGAVPADAGIGDAVGSLCGPVDTTANCGTCGATCNATTGTPSCNGMTCSYMCNAGRADCDLQAPDTNGCECATPACCGASCQTTHSNGVGQNFYSCNPLGTTTEAAAIEACTAYAASVGGRASDCSGNWTCSGNATVQVCYTSSYCWGYTSPGSGNVYGYDCPDTTVGTWD